MVSPNRLNVVRAEIKLIRELSFANHQAVQDELDRLESLLGSNADTPPNGARAVSPADTVVKEPVATGCSGDVLRVLRESGKRLTGEAVAAELERQKTGWSDSMVKATLCVLADLGHVTNRQDTRPRGYGLPEWE